MLIALLIELSSFTLIVQEPQSKPITELILVSIDRLCPHAAICHKDVESKEDVSEQGNSDAVPCCGGLCFFPPFIRKLITIS